MRLQGYIRFHRRLQVAGQDIKEEAVVRGALNIGFTAQGIDATTGYPDIAQQQLQDGIGANNLGAVGMLGGAGGGYNGA